MSDAAQISETPLVEKKTDDVSANGVNGEEIKESGEPETISKSKHKRKKSKAKKAAAAAAAEASVESAPPVPDVDESEDKSEDKKDDTPAPNADSKEVKETDTQTPAPAKKTVADIMAEGSVDSAAIKAVVDSEEPLTDAPKGVADEVRHKRHTMPSSELTWYLD